MPRPHKYKKRQKDLGGPCPICGEPRKLYKKTCSKECSSTLKSRTLKKMYDSGELDFLKDIQKIVGTGNLVAFNKTEKGRENASVACIKRNTIHGNPTEKETIRIKISSSRKEGLASGRIQNPMLDPIKAKEAGRKRKAAYDSGEKVHHMKNPLVVKKVSESLKKAYALGKITPNSVVYRCHYHRGWYVDKNGNFQFYASNWEFLRMEFLDSCTDIKWRKIRQEYRIPYIDMTGVHRTYFPDFEVQFGDKIIIEEIGIHTEEKQHKIRCAKEYFNNKTEIFVALGGNQLNERTW
jgi:hypothetical protein